MAKRKHRRSKKGRRKGRRRVRTLRGRTHSVALEGAGLLGLYEVAVDNMSGETVVGRLIKAPFNKGERAALASEIKSGGMTARVLANTKPLQYVLLYKVAERLPLIGGPLRKIAGALNTAARPLTGKKYKLV